eukprot:TRINITY_DN55285_c0_g1_i1.p1 TRINITY_DN55285_c0_g1~~TRINITY_DN55285_c0_g1_i1.p1  ORF type:complete len:666 (+),score=80.65 TRINITY_DN55285_c0_g1_i1:369-2366(+)
MCSQQLMPDDGSTGDDAEVLWQSNHIPSTIRRPWKVHQDDLECLLTSELREKQRNRHDRCLSTVAGQALDSLMRVGARSAYRALHAEHQRAYTAVSLRELAAFVDWRRSVLSRGVASRGPLPKPIGGSEAIMDATGCPTVEMQEMLQEMWDAVDICSKGEWVPIDAVATLKADGGQWDVLLQKSLSMDDTESVNKELAVRGDKRCSTQDLDEASESPASSSESRNGGSVWGGCESGDEPCRRSQRLRVQRGSHLASAISGVGSSRGAGNRGRLQVPVPSIDRRRGRLHHPNLHFGETGSSDTCDRRRRRGRSESGHSGSGGSRQLEQGPPCRRSARLQSLPAKPAEKTVASFEAGVAPKLPSRIVEMAEPARTVVSEIDVDSIACCVCASAEATDENDVGICDGCNRGFHMRCHIPMLSDFGNDEEQWFCARCVEALARINGLQFRAGDRVWVRLGHSSAACAARVSRLDFSSQSDSTPYWVVFENGGKGAWVGPKQIKERAAQEEHRGPRCQSIHGSLHDSLGSNSEPPSPATSSKITRANLLTTPGRARDGRRGGGREAPWTLKRRRPDDLGVNARSVVAAAEGRGDLSLATKKLRLRAQQFGNVDSLRSRSAADLIAEVQELLFETQMRQEKLEAVLQTQTESTHRSIPISGDGSSPQEQHS